MADELAEFAAASPAGRKRIRNANAAKAAQARGFAVIGYRNPLSHMPKGGQQSPTGDLGLLSQREAMKVAKWKDRPGKPVEASKYLPSKRRPK